MIKLLDIRAESKSSKCIAHHLILGETNKTPASARHKRGCNCKKSSCLKNTVNAFRLVWDALLVVDVKVVKTVLGLRMVVMNLNLKGRTYRPVKGMHQRKIQATL